MLRGTIALRAALLLVCTLACGCGPIGAIAYKVAGPMPIEAKYLPPQTPMLVFVERYNAGGSAGGIDAHQEAELLAREIQRQMQEHTPVPQVDPMSVANVRLKDPTRFARLTVSQIGGETGAEQVLYVNVLSSTIQIGQGSQLVRGQMAARVKVVDVASGAIVWPEDSADGYAVAIQTPIKSLRENTTPAAARNAMFRQMADAIAKLFYKYKPDTEIAE
jgi:hypothetical protein